MDTNNKQPVTNKDPNHIDFFAPKVLWAIIIFLLLVVIVGSAAWYRSVKEAAIVSTECEQNQSCSYDPAIANWKTYSNSRYTLKYPENRITLEENDGTTYFKVKGETQDRGLLSQLTITFNSSLKSVPNNSQKQVINGQEFYVYEINDGPTAGLTEYYYLTTTGTLYVTAYGELPKQILSTFKLTNTSTTTDWKTYSNTEYGFEFKYPKEVRLDNYSADKTSFEFCSDMSCYMTPSFFKIEETSASSLEVAIKNYDYDIYGRGPHQEGYTEVVNPVKSDILMGGVKAKKISSDNVLWLQVYKDGKLYSFALTNFRNMEQGITTSFKFTK